MSVHKDQSYVIKMLRKQINDLEDEKESVKRYAEDSYNHREASHQEWLDNTTKFIQTALDLVENVGKHGKNTHPVGLCLNPKSAFQLRKKAEQMCKDIAAHVQKARGFSNIPLSYRQGKVAADLFVDFESRSGVLKDIMEALRSPCINKIGVHGKPGVGKTMMVREVKRRAEQERLFDAVVMATVGRNPDFPRIQDDIALGLGLDSASNELTSPEASNSNQARLIEKKVLVILDDIWEPRLSLELLGINGKEKDNLSYKIMLISTDRDVVSPLSETQIEIVKLSWEDAWNLFEKIADDPAKSRGLPFYANEITKKCEGLPIAIKTLANALRRMNLIEWKTILRKLQSLPSDEANSSKIPQSLHSAIELHYSGLKSNELQQTFLLCSLLGQNATTLNLLKYGLGLGLFPGVNSIEEARAQVLNLVTILRDSSLLLDSGSSLCFDVHDLVRNFATSTVSKEYGVLALTENAPINWSHMEAMESIKWIYLSNGDTSLLPDELKCPKLTFFHLSKSGPSLASPSNLFRDEEELKVLSFSKMNFLSIPSLISLPKNLCTLCLDQVELGEVNIGTMMGELENLQVLSLAGSDIKELPKQMGQLAKLKLLDLSDCTQLKVILPGVLSNLSRLEELYMKNSFDQWAEGIEGHKNQNASLAELQNLQLTAIEVCIICNIQKIPEGLFSENLARFKVSLGDRWNYWNSSWGSSKLLKLKQDAKISSHPSIRKLIKKINELHLEGLIGVENVVNELDKEGFQELKYLFVQDALEIQHITSVEHAFPALEVLVLRNLENMEKICHGSLGAASFRKLRLINIEFCDKLKNLFSSSIARQLQQLQEIRVKDCSDMEEIVDDKEPGRGNDVEELEGHKFVDLISLRLMRLQHLPKLISFNSSCRTMTLCNDQVVFSNLEELQLFSIMVNTTIWSNLITSCVEKLTKLIIQGCDNLEYLFSSSMARGSLKLRHLQVKECKRMEMIIISENEEEKNNLFFSHLNFLFIKDLQNLVGFYPRNYIAEFPSLKHLQVLNCLKLEGFIVKSSTRTNVIDETQPLSNKKVVFSNLEELQLSSVMVDTTIWYNLMTSCVEKLTKLIIHGCDNLECLFSFSMARGLSKLRHLQVKECKRMRIIITAENEEEKENLIFSQLKFLLMEDLQNLAEFYSGNCIVNFPSLKYLQILDCLKLEGFILTSFARTDCTDDTKPLFNEKVMVSNIEELQLSSIMVSTTIWYSMTSCVEKLTKLIINGCDNLKYLFSSSMARGLSKLRHLQIKECKRMRIIITTEDEEKRENLIFSQLNLLLIEDLESLIGFYSGNIIVEFPLLKYLQVLNCLKLEGFIVKSSIKTDVTNDTQPLFNEKVVFSNLEEFQLSSIIVNATIWYNWMTPFVEKLTKLTIHGCDNLEYIFSSSMAKGLSKLRHLQVKECKRVRIIITTENEEEKENLIFSQLKFLLMEDLQNLAVFYSGNCIVEFPSLELLQILNCLKLEGFIVKSSIRTDVMDDTQALFNKKVVFSNLEELQLSSIMANTMIWCNSMTSCVEKLTMLIIHGCDDLEYLFSFSMARGLLRLKHLQVKECKGMRMIIITENEEENKNLIFSQLNFLSIENLQNLVGFYSGNCIMEFPSLKHLQILDCLKLEGFIVTSSARTDDTQSLFNKKVVFSSNLEELQLSLTMVNNMMYYTYYYPLMQSYVEKLMKLMIHGCDNLTYLFSSSMARGLLKLRHLQVKECKRIEMIIITEKEEEKENLIFSQLNFLLIEDLQNLIEFYSGNCIMEFPSLKQLQILNCPKFERFTTSTKTRPLFNEKVVFSSQLEELQLCSIGPINIIWHTWMISCFEKLEKLVIHGCKNLNYLFSPSMTRGSEGVIKLLLGKLKRLELGDLPKLESIYWEKAAMVCDSLEWIIIWNCYRLRRFPLHLPLLENGQPSPPPSLKQIIVWPQGGWKSLEWDHPNAEGVLLPFYRKYDMFPSELVQGRITRLEVSDIDGENTLLLPSVEELILFQRDNLRSLNDISTIKHAMELKVCRIRSCKNVECFLSSSINPLVQKLEVLDLDHLVKLSVLFEADAITKSPLPPDTFSFLKTIKFNLCNKIKKLFPFRVYLQSLEEISIAYCLQMEEIIAWDAEEAGEEKEGVIQLSLPKLKLMRLTQLSALKSICSKGAIMQCDSLENILIDNCSGLRRIPLYLPLLDNGQPSPPASLKEINVWPQEWWASLEWNHPNEEAVLLPFRKFIYPSVNSFIDEEDEEEITYFPSKQFMFTMAPLIDVEKEAETSASISSRA